MGSLTTVKLELSEANGALGKLRNECNRLYRRAVAELRLALKDEPETRQRDVMRACGIQFISSTADATPASTEEEMTPGNGEDMLPMMTRVLPRQSAGVESAVAPVLYPLPNLYSANGVHPMINDHGVA